MRKCIATGNEENMKNAIAKSEDRELAFSVISSAEELAADLTINEMMEIYESLPEHSNNICAENEDHVSEILFTALNDNYLELPEFSPEVLLYASPPERNKEIKKIGKNTGKTSKPASTKRKSKLNFQGKSFIPGPNKPRSERHLRLLNLAENSIEPVTFEQLSQLLIGDDGSPESHINYSLKMGFLVEEGKDEL